MNDVVAVIEGDPRADPVTAGVAAALGELLHDRVRDLALVAATPQGRAGEVVERLDRAEAWTAVLTAREDPQAACWDVVERAAKPVVLVPPTGPGPAAPISRVLLPLDGDLRTAEAVADVVARLAAKGARILPVHVFEPGTVPAFWDQPAHTGVSWSREFILRNLPHDGDVFLRRGVPADEVLAVAEACAAELIVLGWAQHLEEGRARTMRRVVLEGRAPVLLAPLRVTLGRRTRDLRPSSRPGAPSNARA